MSEHLKQYSHNQQLSTYLEKAPLLPFTDWHITVIFYSALHLVEAVAEKSRRKIGYTHEARNNNLNPLNPDAKMPLPQEAYDAYYDLYQASRNVRYKCWVVNQNSNLLQVTLSQSKHNLDIVKQYCQKQGIKLPK